MHNKHRPKLNKRRRNIVHRKMPFEIESITIRYIFINTDGNSFGSNGLKLFIKGQF